MAERHLNLQGAVDLLTDMIAQRVQDYVGLKEKLPSFGPDVDQNLDVYLKALENFVQATIVWYYLSPSWSSSIEK